MNRSGRNIVVAVVLTVGLAVGVVLVVTGGDDGPTGATTTTAAEPTDGVPATGGRSPLPLDDTSQAAIEELTGLVVPADATDFLTARLDDGRQLDITFVVPAASVGEFVAASSLPDPVPDERVVIHSSPLWRLNPDDGTTLRGVADSYGSVDRAVELVTGADGTVRARIVVTSAT